MTTPRYPTIEVKIIGEPGNVVNVLSLVTKFLQVGKRRECLDGTAPLDALGKTFVEGG